MPLRAAFARMRATASAEMSTASASAALRRQPQRETAVVAEAVEQPAARVAGGGVAVLALIQEQTCLLPRPQVHLVLHGAFVYVDCCGAPRRRAPHFLVQSLEQAHLGIVARQDAGRGQQCPTSAAAMSGTSRSMPCDSACTTR